VKDFLLLVDLGPWLNSTSKLLPELDVRLREKSKLIRVLLMVKLRFQVLAYSGLLVLVNLLVLAVILLQLLSDGEHPGLVMELMPPVRVYLPQVVGGFPSPIAVMHLLVGLL